jgi:NADH-quinone oxidoreductase subunit M
MLGVFMALNFFVFYIFWELVLIPMALLIGIWGGGRRVYSAIKFFLYTLVGSLLMLVGIVALYFEHGNLTGVFTLNVLDLYNTPYGMVFQILVFFAFFLAFAVKVPLWPLHTWLPDAHVDAPTAGSVILAGVLLKMGGYGFLRFSLPILPKAAVAFAPWIIGLSVIAIIYGAYVTLVQKDLKKLVAYSSVSHMGFVTLGIFMFSMYGLQGAIVVMFSHGLLTGGLFLVVGVLYERLHTRQISELGGLATPMPAYAAMAGILMLGSLGLPGLSGFVGEFLVFLSVFQNYWVLAVIVVFVVILAAAYLLWMFMRVFYLGKPKDEHHILIDLSWKEGVTIAPLVALALFVGVYPAPLLNLVAPAVQQILQAVGTQGPAVASLFIR